MKKLNKFALGAGMGAAVILATAGSALAHDDLGGDPANPEFDGDLGGQGEHQAPHGNAGSTTDFGYPAGGFAADGLTVQGMDDAALDATAHVLGYIEIDAIINLTALVEGDDAAVAANMVNSGGSAAVPGEALTPGSVIYSGSGQQGAFDQDSINSAFDFPTQTPTGKVYSDEFQIIVDSNTDWDLYAGVSDDFSNPLGNSMSGDGGTMDGDGDNKDNIKASESFGARLSTDGQFTVGPSPYGADVMFGATGTYTKINGSVLDGEDGGNPGLDSDDDAVNDTSLPSDADPEDPDHPTGYVDDIVMQFISGPDYVEAGDYSGTITIAVMANHDGA